MMRLVDSMHQRDSSRLAALRMTLRGADFSEVTLSPSAWLMTVGSVKDS
jgi:hypothetical protein